VWCSGTKGPLDLLSVPSHGELNHVPYGTPHTASDRCCGLKGDLKGLLILWLSRGKQEMYNNSVWTAYCCVCPR